MLTFNHFLTQKVVFNIWIILFFTPSFLSNAIVNDNPELRVKSIVITPQEINDDGSGVELFIQIDFVEPAISSGVLKLITVPGKDNSGMVRWKEQPTFSVHINDVHLEIHTRLYVIKNGTIGIKAETSSNEENFNAIYWIPVTLQEK